MIFLQITSLNSRKEYQEFCIGNEDIDACFEGLSILVKKNCQLLSVILIAGKGNTIPLPIEAFDGEPMQETLKALQQEWETILAQPYGCFQTKEQRTYARNQKAVKWIHHALQARERISQKRELTNRRLDNLFKKMDTLQAYIEEIKSDWGVV